VGFTPKTALSITPKSNAFDPTPACAMLSLSEFALA